MPTFSKHRLVSVGVLSLWLTIGCQAREGALEEVAAPYAGPSLEGYRFTGRSLLDSEQAEDERYGLFSYILVTYPPEPDSAEEELCLALFREYLRVIPIVEALEDAAVSLESINVTYLPVLRRPLEPSAEELLREYDFVRAKVLLAKVVRRADGGPFIVSSLEPLSTTELPSGPFLIQDLERKPPGLVREWLQLFEAQAARREFWEPLVVEELALEVRTGLAEVAALLPAFQEGTETLGSLMETTGDWVSVIFPSRAVTSATPTDDP